jgi:hypothetical protein
MRRLPVLLLALVGLLVPLAACSGDDGGAASTSVASTTVKQGTELRVQDLPAAVAAVEAALGGPQRYAEINLTTGGVNLFVASSDSEELAYYYDAATGSLQAPDAPEPISGTPFSLEGMDLTQAPSLVQQLQDQFPGSQVLQLAIVQLPDQGLVWALRSQSALGGLLNVFFAPTGALLAVSPAS